MPRKLYCHRASKIAPKTHTHPSHPYVHQRSLCHVFGPKSRIKDRKGKAFRSTKVEHRRKGVKGTYRARTGQIKRWD